ncbi:MAG: cation:proton antiporter [Candidatus Promineifilaceae bacterium]
MAEEALVGLASILFLGVGAQWLAWRLRLPSILLLLALGFIAGPITGFLHPDEIFGDLLFPIVSMSVAIILFEGGLSLRLTELPQVGKVMLLLITVGALITWTISAVAAHFVLEMTWSLAVLLGAVLIVTGPTVIGPLLRQIRPSGKGGVILKWEGILIDPVGAVLAVLIFDAILAGEFDQATGMVVWGVLETLVIGIGLGFLGAGAMTIFLRRYWIPDFLQNGVSLLVALSLFALSNILRPESGLVTVTLMGVLLANQRLVAIKHIVEFKENLRVLLIGSLFILLASRLDIQSVLDAGWRGLLFLAVLIFLARPLSVYVSTMGSQVTKRSRLFLSWMAPRGIVAASVASIFAYELSVAGIEGTDQLVGMTFLVIVGTVMLYGLTAAPLARKLGLSEENPQGVLIVGAHQLGRDISRVLHSLGFKVMLVDTNERNIEASRAANLPIFYGNALSEEAIEDIDFAGIGRLLAITPNDEVNALATLHYGEIFDRSEMFQLPVEGKGNRQEPAPKHLRGRFLFDPRLSYKFLNGCLAAGGEIRPFPIEGPLTLESFKEEFEEEVFPLFLMRGSKELVVFTVDFQPVLNDGQTLVVLVPPKDKAPTWATREYEQAVLPSGQFMERGLG